jgi:hypothetical protein
MDGVGDGLAEAQVFLLPIDRPGAPPVAEVRTRPNGRYDVNLEPGVYRVAAVKEGYLTTFRRVNTMVRTTVNLVLHPMPSPEEIDEPLPGTEAWSLQVPRRSILRDEGPGLVLADVIEPVAPAPASRDMVDGTVAHMFAVAGLSSDSGKSSDVQGSETHISLSTALRDRGQIKVSGHRDNLRGTGTLDDAGSAERERTALQVDLAYDTGIDSRLGVRAFFDANDLMVVSPDSRLEAQRSWGYDASWSKQIDPVSSVEVKVDYRDTSLDMPSGMGSGFQPGVDDSAAAPANTSLSNRMVGAETSYHSVAGDRHQVRVGMRAQMLHLPAPTARVTGPGAFVGSSAEAGWSVRVDAEDAWRVSRPVTVLYGVAYHHSLQSVDWSVAVPRVGAVWNPRWFKIRGVVSYFTEGRQPSYFDPVTPATIEAARPEVGYDLAVDVPMPSGMRLVGAVSYVPVQYGFAGYDRGAESGVPDRPIYLTDGNAETHESSLRLERRFGTTATWIRVSRGNAEGMLAHMPAVEMPVYMLSERSLDFATGRFGARMLPWGTELQAEYQRVEETSFGGTAVAAVPVQRFIEVRVSQDLLWFDTSRSTWRLLLAARSVSSDDFPGPLGAASGIAGDDPEIVSLLNRQVSAGVSVLF